MTTNEDTLYDNKNDFSTNQNESQPQANDSANDKKERNNNMAKRVAAILGGATLGVATAVAVDKMMPSGGHADTTAEGGMKVVDTDGNMSFDEAFNEARAQLGPGGAFRWHGGLYSTYTEEEWNSMSDAEKEQYGASARSIANGEETNPGVYASNAGPANDSGIEAQHKHSGHSKTNSNIHQASDNDNHKQQMLDMRDIQVGSESEMSTDDGGKFIVAEAKVNGYDAVLVDTDHDGVYDKVAIDINRNENIEDYEFHDLHDKGIVINVQDRSLVALQTADNADSGITIHSEHEQTINGRTATVGVGEYKGKNVVVLDLDHDGKYDEAYVDENNNGGLDQNDTVLDLSQSNIRVGTAMAEPTSNTVEVNKDNVAISSEQHVEYKGETIIAGVGTVNGQMVSLGDINKDGTYDMAVVDANKNGNIERNEVHDISGKGIEVQDRSLVGNSTLMTSGEDAQTEPESCIPTSDTSGQMDDPGNPDNPYSAQDMANGDDTLHGEMMV